MYAFKFIFSLFQVCAVGKELIGMPTGGRINRTAFDAGKITDGMMLMKENRVYLLGYIVTTLNYTVNYF